MSSLTTPTHLHWPAGQHWPTIAVHQQVEAPLPYAEECDDSEDVFAMGDRPPRTNRRVPEPTATHTLQQMFALPAGWDTRYARSPDNQMPKGNRREIDHSLIRTGDSILKHGPVGTTPRSSASVVDNLDICRPVARDRMLCYHLNQQVGTFNLTVVNSGMVIANRETLHRPGPHPHRSVRTSFDPHFIFIHHTVFTFFTAG